MADGVPETPTTVAIETDTKIFSLQAVLKTCYWFSRDYAYEISQLQGGQVIVSLTPKQPSAPSDNLRAEFVEMVTDFTLRERIEARTLPIRELLLAKAFAEAGVLEDSPEGNFGDAIEEEKPNGLFKILGNV